MTKWAQPTSVNKPKPGIRGYAPRAAGLTGTHRDAVKAEALPAALEQVAQGIPGKRPSAGLMDAVNTGQGAMGNRRFMRFVEGVQQQTRAPGADSGNAPLQMMWRNPGRRGIAWIDEQIRLESGQGITSTTGRTAGPVNQPPAPGLEQGYFVWREFSRYVGTGNKTGSSDGFLRAKICF